MTPTELPFALPGFDVDEVSEHDGVIEITAHSTAEQAICPSCKQRSRRVHSYYQRSPADLPVSDRWVRLHLTVRRFRCQVETCPKVIFAERWPDLLAAKAQRTERLTTGLSAVAFALGGQAGCRLAGKLKMPASGDTLLRIIRRTPEAMMDAPSVLGVDDWAKRRGRVYGTILVDLERHRVVDILTDRTAETLADWLKAHTSVSVVARDRSTQYARGITLGAPQAQQVADRWHLLVNLREALQRLLDRLRPELQARMPVKMAPKPGEIPILRLRHRSAQALAARDGRRGRRIALHQKVHRLRHAGHTIRAIARQLKMSRMTVYRYLSQSEYPEHARHKRLHSQLDPFTGYLTQQWLAGCRNAAQLWREINGQGYPGTRRQVAQWAYERREQPTRTTPTRYLDTQAQSAAKLITVNQVPDRAPLPVSRQLVWLFLKHTNQLEADELSQRKQLLRHPLLAKARHLVQEFQGMVRERKPKSWKAWLKACDAAGIPELVNFAAGLRQDEQAVRAALTLEWSNGQTEGQVNRLKLLKRQMYGRANFDLLRMRCIAFA
jgi:transposase